MQILLKHQLVLILILFLCFDSEAQTLKKPDVIQKIDRTSLEVVIDEINKTDILYRKANDPKGPLYAMPKSDVNKIIWNNGDVEEITPMPVSVKTAAKPTDMLVKSEKQKLLFWDQVGLFGGFRAGAGLGMITKPYTSVLAAGSKPAFNAGGTLGFRGKSFSVQIEALYTGLSYSMNVSDSFQAVEKIEGQQGNLVVPLTATFYTKLNKTKVGLTLGGFGSMQLGRGSTKVTNSENKATNFRNCADCSDKATFGVVGGITATVFERSGYSIFIDARWYHSLVDNSEYKIAESGVKLNTAILGAGVLFNLAH
jgi:hypothetical protein